MHCYVVAAGVPCGSPDRLAEAVHRGVRLKRDGNAISTTQKVYRLRLTLHMSCKYSNHTLRFVEAAVNEGVNRTCQKS